MRTNNSNKNQNKKSLQINVVHLFVEIIILKFFEKKLKYKISTNKWTPFICRDFYSR